MNHEKDFEVTDVLLAADRKTFMPAGRVCPMCGDYGSFVGRREGHVLRECSGVSVEKFKDMTLTSYRHAPILLSWPEGHSLEQYEAIYQSGRYYHEKMQVQEGQRPSLARDAEHLVASHARLKLLTQFVSGGRLLDVGAGTGAFVVAATAWGFDAAGIEPAPDMIVEAARLGRTLLSGTWQSAGGEYSVVCLHDVWEHLTRPLDCLRHLAKCLADDGMLVVEVPLWGCAAARREGLAWKHIRPLQHLFLPSDGAARAMFAECGLEVEAAIAPVRGRIGKMAYYLSRGENYGAL